MFKHFPTQHVTCHQLSPVAAENLDDLHRCLGRHAHPRVTSCPRVTCRAAVNSMTVGNEPQSIRCHTPWSTWSAADLLAAVLGAAPDFHGGACVGHHQDYDRAAAGDPVAIEQTQAWCASCIHLGRCRAYRDSLPERARRAHGVLAGVVTRAQPRSAPAPECPVHRPQLPRQRVRRPTAGGGPRPTAGGSGAAAQRRALRAARREARQRAVAAS
jgi:hypothetical protein